MSNVQTQEDAVALQLSFKPADLRAAMVAITEAALAQAPEFWPDEQSFVNVPTDSRNAIGNGFKTLFRCGIIEQTGNWRNSTIPEQKGRRVWGWRCKNPSLARCFLKRNGAVPVRGQLEMTI